MKKIESFMLCALAAVLLLLLGGLRATSRAEDNTAVGNVESDALKYVQEDQPGDEGDDGDDAMLAHNDAGSPADTEPGDVAEAAVSEGDTATISVSSHGSLESEWEELQEFKILMMALKSRDPGVRAAAAAALADHGGREVLEPLILLLSDPSIQVREAGRISLLRIVGRER